MKFRKRGDRERAAQHFDAKKIFVMKHGEKINMYDYIQANNEDTEIEATWVKYGSIKPMEMNKQEILGEIQSMDLRDFCNLEKNADNLWKKLPLEVRDHFQNNKNLFLQNGEQYLKDLIAKEKQTTPTVTTQPKEPTKEVTTDEPKQ